MNNIFLHQHYEGYRYNSDSIFLFYFMSLFSPKGSILDVGAGCGIIGILLKKHFENIELSMIDLQEINAKLCEENTKINQINANIICEDFLSYKSDKTHDIIVSNPPFYRENLPNSLNLHKAISRDSSYLPLDLFVKKCHKILKPRGYVFLCYDASNLTNICENFKSHDFAIEDICFVHARKDKNAHLVLIRARKSSKAFVKVHPSIYMHKKNTYTKMAKKIFAFVKTRTLI